MARNLIPRGPCCASKKVESTDFEKYFGDLIACYISTGLTLAAPCPNGLSVDLSCGNGRIKGLWFENTVTCNTSCLAACDTTFLFAQLNRDGMCRPCNWTVTTNLTGVAAACSQVLGSVTTNCMDVTAVDNTLNNKISGVCNSFLFGDGECGDLVVCGCTSLCTVNYYNDVCINCGGTLTFCCSPALMYVKGTLTVMCGGIITVEALGAAGGVAGTSVGGTGGGQGCPQAGCPAPASNGNVGTVGSITSTPSCPAGGGGNSGGGTGGCGGISPTACGGAGRAGPEVGQGGGAPGTHINVYHHVSEFIRDAPTITDVGGGGGSGAAAGAGGGGGGGPGANGGPGGTGANGGKGGTGGGQLTIFANIIDVQAGGQITAKGEDGDVGQGPLPACCIVGNQGGTGVPAGTRSGSGGGGGSGSGGGGGGGGNGGLLMLVYTSLVETGTVCAVGGVLGCGGAASPAHGLGAPPQPQPGPGAAGCAGCPATGCLTAGLNGTAGNTGVIVKHKV